MMLEQTGGNRVEDPEVDAEQGRVMTAISPDGRPPDIAAARANWRRTVIVAIAVAILGVALLVILLGPTAGGLASILLVGYVALTVPVWGAGLLRGREERIAHDIAQKRIHPDRR